MIRTRYAIGLLAAACALLVLTACGAGSSTSSAGGSASPAATAAGQSGPKQWSKPPEMTIDPNKTYKAEMKTSKGNMTIELFAKEAPKTVNNFVFLSKQGYYDNVIFHRIIKSFMVQTGDPQGTGRGGPGYQFEDELKTTHTYEPGIVAMANSGPNTNGSQFFICSGPDCAAFLNPQPNYSIFGKVVEGMDTLQKIADTPVEMGGESTPSKPTEKVTIDKITIKEE
ncbi:peptidylprolyl isomerase [Paenibacillus athensensis]|uniref:Peptidyl-prolyl cis-trans isomerase n=1 Tax=Paenibacillus athensensis TaxID=1967502 RepID=A0A4Y8Q998_9BACL|nr:peptidylprolyl isomerase [Paenibacillus athensensis]MCD1257351.1 peptidylprolyl isomerase [Paenibacillus athensensis]